MEEYKATEQELKLQARFTFEGSMHTWGLPEKGQYLKYLNNRAGLPFGTIGMIRTEHKQKDGTVNVKEIPYASRQTTVELGRKHKISLEQVKENITSERVIYTYRATDIDTGRFVDAVGACSFFGWGKPLEDGQKANKIMHAETKAKRRAVLEVCGLAFLDDSEVEDMEGATRIDVSTGEVEKQAPKGNSNAVATATKTPATPASTGTGAAPALALVTPAAEPPKSAAVAAPTPAIAPVTPPAPPSNCPARYADHAALFVGDAAAIVADKPHMDLIVKGCKDDCGWDGPTMSKWLFDTFGVRSANAKETLTLDVFSRIMSEIDTTLTAAGR